MSFALSAYVFAGLAGLLSTLSPCVLPLIPILVASAIGAHRLGAWALAAGLTLSFTTVGLLLSTVGIAIGLDAVAVRDIGAVILLVFGLLLMSTMLQARFAAVTAGGSNAAMNLLNRINPQGLSGQLVVGLLLGVVWSPCVGPTLGAASTLAAQGQHLSQVALIMLMFGVGASIPLIVLGGLSGTAMARLRNRLLHIGAIGKFLLGLTLVLLSVVILLGWDKSIESLLVDYSPTWLTNLTTRF